MSNSLKPISFENGVVTILDQRKVPHQEHYDAIKNLQDGFDAISLMKVRGAPLIGFTAIFTMGVWCENPEKYSLDEAVNFLNSARPTAVNLAFELIQVKELILNLKNDQLTLNEIAKHVFEYGLKKIERSSRDHQKMAEIADKELESLGLKKNLKILTHCNTGRLACGGMGTALGVIEHLAAQNKINKVWVDETRPYLQGSRLTAFELGKSGVDHEIVVEGAANHLMKNGFVDAIFVGADRIAANGDTANKIGTANLSILAEYYHIPFYIVAPTSTFDLSIKDGGEIEIEIRPETEIKEYHQSLIAPIASKAFNPSFDISDGKNITGIICEKGLIKPVNSSNLKGIVSGN